MKIFVNEEKPGNNDLIRGNGFSPDPSQNIVIYRNRKDFEALPSILIDSESGNIDIRDSEGQTFAAFDAENKSFRVCDRDVLVEADVAKSLIDQANSRIDVVTNEIDAKIKALEEAIQDKVPEPIPPQVSYQLPIGSIIQSFIAEEKFQKECGDGWVLCDGRSVLGSSYHQKGYGKNAPDCRGLFLRSSGGMAYDVGMIQQDSTSAKGLLASSGISGMLRGNVTVIGETAESKANIRLFKVSDDNHQKGVWTLDNRRPFEDDDGQNVSLAGGHGNQKIFTDVGHSHTFRANAKVDIDTSMASVSTEITSQSSETRPKNITVNTFIRVN